MIAYVDVFPERGDRIEVREGAGCTILQIGKFQVFTDAQTLARIAGRIETYLEGE